MPGLHHAYLGASQALPCIKVLYGQLVTSFLCLGYAPEPQAYMNPGDSGTGVEVNPGSLGQMDVNSGTYGGSGYDNDSFEEEQPLLKELGIDVELIKQKVIITFSVANFA